MCIVTLQYATTSSPTFVGFFVCGMMCRFCFDEIDENESGKTIKNI